MKKAIKNAIAYTRMSKQEKENYKRAAKDGARSVNIFKRKIIN